MNRNWIWGNKPWQAFKAFAILFSFFMNFILLLVILSIAPLTLPIVNDIVKPIVGGLNESFDEMSSATITQEIPVRDTMPISFTLPLSATTEVLVTDGVPLNIPATFTLPGGGGQIVGSVTLELPAGLALPVQLEMEVPVDQEIDVALDVAVDIPLAKTELGTPFIRLQDLFGPLDAQVDSLPDNSDELIDRVLNDDDEEGEAAPESTE